MLERSRGKAEYKRLYLRFREVAPELGFNEDVIRDEAGFDRLFELFRQVTPLSVVDTLTKLAEVTNQVCEIRDTSPDVRLGTGFLVGPDLVLTAFHVVAGKTFSNLRCSFNNIMFGTGTVQNSASTVAAVTKEEDSSPLAVGQPVMETAFDFSLLRLDRVVGDTTRKFIKVAQNRVELDDAIYVVDFPGAQSVSFSGGTVSQALIGNTDAAFQHNASTSDGASGAPVFDNGFRLVGLHRGKAATDNEAIDVSRIFGQLRPKGFV